MKRHGRSKYGNVEGSDRSQDRRAGEEGGLGQLYDSEPKERVRGRTDGHSPTFTAVLESSSEARLVPRGAPRLRRLELLGVRRALAIEARCGWPLIGEVGGVAIESMMGGGGARELEHLWHWRPGGDEVE